MMRKKQMGWLGTAVIVVLAGCILAALSTSSFETNTYEVDEAFGDISITADTADIRFALSPDEKCRVECREKENARHRVAVQDGALVVANDRPWYSCIGLFGFGSPRITVYLPKTAYNALSVSGSTGDVEIPKGFSFEDADISLSTGDVDFCASVTNLLKIKASTGSICVEGISAGSLEISVTTGGVSVSGVSCRGDVAVRVSTGETTLTDITCENLTSSGTTGNASLRNAVAGNRLFVERSTGNVEFSGCDAREIQAKTTTGSVTGSFLSSKTFVTHTDTGRVDVPPTGTGGRCEIRTHTGDIRIS